MIALTCRGGCALALVVLYCYVRCWWGRVWWCVWAVAVACVGEGTQEGRALIPIWESNRRIPRGISIIAFACNSRYKKIG